MSTDVDGPVEEDTDFGATTCPASLGATRDATPDDPARASIALLRCSPTNEDERSDEDVFVDASSSRDMDEAAQSVCSQNTSEERHDKLKQLITALEASFARSEEVLAERHQGLAGFEVEVFSTPAPVRGQELEREQPPLVGEDWFAVIERRLTGLVRRADNFNRGTVDWRDSYAQLGARITERARERHGRRRGSQGSQGTGEEVGEDDGLNVLLAKIDTR